MAKYKQATFTGRRIRRYRDAGIVTRAHSILASTIAILAALIGTAAFTIRLYVASVWS
jgi:hypothetical protein